MAYFTTLYSGSSGNCGLVRCGQQYLLIDMGKSCRTTLTALKSLGLAVSDCVGILITHEHSDHVSGLDTFLKSTPFRCTAAPTRWTRLPHAVRSRRQWTPFPWTARRWKSVISR